MEGLTTKFQSALKLLRLFYSAVKHFAFLLNHSILGQDLTSLTSVTTGPELFQQEAAVQLFFHIYLPTCLFTIGPSISSNEIFLAFRGLNWFYLAVTAVYLVTQFIKICQVKLLY